MSALTFLEQESLQRAIRDMEYYPDAVMRWIAAHLTPEDVFPESDLKTWAEDSGFRSDEDVQDEVEQAENDAKREAYKWAARVAEEEADNWDAAGFEETLGACETIAKKIRDLGDEVTP